MKVATITFHWANNYGAVLQSYALQKYLLNNGYNTEVINYMPFKLYCREVLRDIARRNVHNIKKRKRIQAFVKKEIRLSRKVYRNSKRLSSKGYDCVICGSDQIWNEWFLFHAEKKPCLSYYLNFVRNNCTRISYAASFGTDKLKEETKGIVAPLLQMYRGISVRENTALEIVSDLQLDSVRVCDPTFLLDVNDYLSLIRNTPPNKRKEIFTYVLHGEQEKISRLVRALYSILGSQAEPDNTPISCDVYEWLARINNATFVITNSFHATVFALMFHVPFFSVPVEGKKMNDRICTLLNDVGLLERFSNTQDTEEICKRAKVEIDWDLVDRRISKQRYESAAWLISMINR